MNLQPQFSHIKEDDSEGIPVLDLTSEDDEVCLLSCVSLPHAHANTCTCVCVCVK